jgi:uncharacterized protein DUF3631
MNINSMSDMDLDRLAVATDARQGERMLQSVSDFLARFVAYPSEHARTAHALWIVHTHLMDAWESTPRLAFLSPEPGSGKTRALEITELLVPRPVSAVNVSPAYLFRKIGGEDGLPTVLHDEIDATFGAKAKEHEDLRALINAGHRRGAMTGRCATYGKTITPEEIPAYCAIAMAGLGWLPDTILSRSVIIRMRRRKPGEKVEPYRLRVHGPAGEKVRSQIEVWARQSTGITLPDPDSMPAEVQDRDADVWEALLAVAEHVGGAWPRRALDAAVALVADSKDIETSLGIRLLADMRKVFGDETEKWTTNMLAELHGLPESPWTDIRGKPLDDRGLAKRLHQYGIKSKMIRDGPVTRRGYDRADFVDAWEQYPLPEKSETSETAKQSAPVAPVAPVTQFPGKRVPCAQCNADDGKQAAHEIGGELVMLHEQCVRFWKRPA